MPVLWVCRGVHVEAPEKAAEEAAVQARAATLARSLGLSVSFDQDGRSIDGRLRGTLAQMQHVVAAFAADPLLETGGFIVDADDEAEADALVALQGEYPGVIGGVTAE